MLADQSPEGTLPDVSRQIAITYAVYLKQGYVYSEWKE